MAIVGETIDLDLPLQTARAKWNEYVSGMVIGSGKGPGEREHPFRWRKPERDAADGDVQFASMEEGVTRLTVVLDYPDLRADDPAESARATELRAYLRYDLDLYKEYAEGRLRLAS
jgi:hypothetical protein